MLPSGNDAAYCLAEAINDKLSNPIKPEKS